MSNTNFRFYIHFIDDYSRYTWIYPLRAKSEALQAFVQFKSLVENLFERKIKTLHTDGGGEYQAFTRFVTDNGIAFDRSYPHTSAQNGRAERKHRHIVEMGLTLLAQAGVPQKYWWDAFQTTVYLINRLPTPVLANQTPFERVYGKKPDYKFLKVFGSACFPCLRPYQTHKFQYQSTKCVNLGYSDSHKRYKCLSSTCRLYISRHVIFNEHEFPFKHGFLNTHQPESTVSVFIPTWFTPLHHSIVSSTTPKNSLPKSQQEKSSSSPIHMTTNSENTVSAAALSPTPVSNHNIDQVGDHEHVVDLFEIANLSAGSQISPDHNTEGASRYFQAQDVYEQVRMETNY